MILRAVVCVGLFVGVAGAQVKPVAPTFGDGPSVVIPYAGKVDFDHLDRTLKVRAQVNGGPVGEFTVDTGSVGMILEADEVPGIDPKAPVGHITYTSSGLTLNGVWTAATVMFPDAKGGAAVAVIPVLAVSSESCSGEGVNASGCKASDHPHTHMMGVGFGRAEDAHPDKNVFLNLKEMQAGKMLSGYMIRRDGIALGLSAKAVGDGFVWQKLVERAVSGETKKAAPGLKDWETAAGSFMVAGKQEPSGTVLIDSGLTNMILAAESGGKGEVADGTPVTVDLLGGQLKYSFAVGDDKNPQTPRKVGWVRPKHGVFVNTGLRALAGYDYLYDAEGGWLGLRPVKP